MIYKRLYMLPVLVSIGFLITFVVFYALAWALGHVAAVLPYISETGSSLPESCFFAQVINVGCFFLAVIMYIRYLFIKELLTEDNRRTKKNNVACLCLGWVGTFGISMVGNFQVENMPKFHVVGSFLGFGCGSIYQIIMWHISFKLRASVKVGLWVHYFRLILALISLVTFVCIYTFSFISVTYFKGKNFSLWDKDDGGYDYHLVSTVTEWMNAMTTMLYLLLFCADFKYANLEDFKVNIIEA